MIWRVKRITLASVLKLECRGCEVKSKIRYEAIATTQIGGDGGDLDLGCDSGAVRSGQFQTVIEIRLGREY